MNAICGSINFSHSNMMHILHRPILPCMDKSFMGTSKKCWRTRIKQELKVKVEHV